MAAVSGALGLMAVLCIISSSCSDVFADSDMLQDFCVADLSSSAVRVNGYPCTSSTSADDFFSSVLANPAATNTSTGSRVTGANVQAIPGLNTLGISLSRIDYSPGGLNPPHTHPRATELVFVLYGELDVAFITTANVRVAKTLRAGDVFVFPRGLVHYQKNNGAGPAAVISAFNSQLPGTQSIPTTLFDASPEVPDDVLGQAFHVGTKEVKKIKSRFG